MLRPQWNPGGACDAGTYEVEQDPPLTVDVFKTADPSVVRTWVWSVEKWASHKRVVLARKNDGAKKDDQHLVRFAQDATVDYTVRASAKPVDDRHRVRGRITILVPGNAGGTAELTDVSDVVPPGLAADVVCDVELPFVLEAGTSFNCEYSLDLPDGNERTNVATATAQVPGEPGTSEEFDSSPREFDFDDPVVRKRVDTKARVYDSRVGFLGWVSIKDEPAYFTYSVLVAPGGLAPLCGRGTVDNTASLRGDETEKRDTASVSIPVEVRCFESAPGGKQGLGDTGGGSTDKAPLPKPDDPGVSTNDRGQIDGIVNPVYPPHDTSCSKKGMKRGVKGDPMWLKLGPQGRKTKFFATNKTYRQMTRVKGKRRYYKFSKVYVIAKLNVHAGAPIDPRTTRALKWSDRYFDNNAPKSKPGKKLKRQMARQMKQLRNYNKMARHYRGGGCTT